MVERTKLPRNLNVPNNVKIRRILYVVDPARIELATLQCECSGIPLTYRPKCCPAKQDQALPETTGPDFAKASSGEASDGIFYIAMVIIWCYVG